MLYCNESPIVWNSKMHANVKSPTFGSESVALRISSEIISSLQYQLQIFVIPILVHEDVFIDNYAVYKNTAFAESTCMKKFNSI